MKNTIRLAFAYLKYYKKQTLSLFLGIVLSASILTGIGSLMGSGRNAALENARDKTGDWHYYVRCDFPWFPEFQEHTQGTGYKVEKSGVLTIRKVLEEPYEITMAYADSGYLDIMGRRLEQGHYPQQENEVAMDTYTLRNLEIPAELGSRVELDNEEFTLCGIISSMPDADSMQVLVDEDLNYGANGKFLYMKFDESRKVYKQAAKMADTFGIDKTGLKRNNETLKYLGGEGGTSVLETIKTGISIKGAGLPYIWYILNENWNLTEKVVVAALGLFSIFIMYSLFQVSVIRRMSQYSILQTVGMGEKSTFGILAAELFMIFLPGYPLGYLLGNGAASLIYRVGGRIFVYPEDFIVHQSGDTKLTAVNLPAPGKFHVSEDIIAGGAVFFLVLILLISFILVRRMHRLTLRELLAKEGGKKRKNRKIYSIKFSNLTGVLTKKFMFARKGAFIGILLSLSAGCLLFLGSAYVAENTRINNELTFKADDGLGSDIQIYLDTDDLKTVIPEKTIQQLKQIDGIGSLSAVRYMLGEVPFVGGAFNWPSYYPETADQEDFKPDPVLMEKYNGVAVQTGENDYLLKVNIYGYDDQLLDGLNEYLLKGEINPDNMRANNSVIFKTIMDGQGNYDGIDLKAGDAITLKTPVSSAAAPEVLRFESEADQYREAEFQAAAITSRPLAKVDAFIEDDGKDRVDIIMTNEQMEKNFGVSGYRTVSISLTEGADASKVSDEIRRLTSGIGKCIVKDYTEQIKTENQYLAQKMMFFYGVGAILLVISFLHIVNSMQYLVAARKHEFGILRAMGITDAGFRKMLVKEGIRYGVYSSLVMAVLYLIVQKILYYFMIHVYLYLHPKASMSPLPILGMALVNILICVAAVLISGQAVLKEQIIREIRT
ncbi:FtsX-like permease family protein [Clostridium sp. D5]|uniref:FtsX-like permease family protein n=1 Tax=Clostridium sp. D5 TaxID=556261 RepID=UPI0001FC7BA3|nr:FtsX-like permease family protein [Clostridium sp. D5]EGB92979.1 efflux ABC transporter, permease protein [Clostridium sp. D5]